MIESKLMAKNCNRVDSCFDHGFGWVEDVCPTLAMVLYLEYRFQQPWDIHKTEATDNDDDDNNYNNNNEYQLGQNF